jgi:hypothetical protein
MWEDPIVNEVRQQRLALEAEAGNDWDEIIARAVEFQRQFVTAQPLVLTESANVASRTPAPDKLAAMREAMNDPLFLADLREVANGFNGLEVKR